MALPSASQLESGTTALSSLASLTNTAAGLFGLVLVSPSSTVGYQPLNAPTALGQYNPNFENPPSFVFHYEGENTAFLESDITDHYVEDNTAIQDQIAIRPEIVTVHGFIGELNNVPSGRALQLLQSVANTLTPIGAFTPQLSTTAQLAYDEAFYAYQTLTSAANSAISAYSGIAQLPGTQIVGTSEVYTVGAATVQNLQQQMFQQFYGYWFNRTLFVVQTPWAVFSNMAIKSVRAIQDAETRFITDFEVTFKKIRVANTTAVSGGIAGAIAQARASASSATSQSNGTSAGTTSSTTFGSAISTQNTAG